jgi:hypothetical protein
MCSFHCFAPVDQVSELFGRWSRRDFKRTKTCAMRQKASAIAARIDRKESIVPLPQSPLVSDGSVGREVVSMSMSIVRCASGDMELERYIAGRLLRSSSSGTTSLLEHDAAGQPEEDHRFGSLVGAFGKSACGKQERSSQGCDGLK